MVGNDVVDLGDPESRTDALHPRFDVRVFGPDERRAIAASAEPDRTRWTLWAAKESVFKLLRKRDPQAGFSPSRLRVDLAHGRVEGFGNEFALHVLDPGATGDAVHVVACDRRGRDDRFVTAVAPVPDGRDPGEAARGLALDHLAACIGTRRESLRIARGPDRIPRLVREDGRATPIDLSISHHGRFVAFAAELPA